MKGKEEIFSSSNNGNQHFCKICCERKSGVEGLAQLGGKCSSPVIIEKPLCNMVLDFADIGQGFFSHIYQYWDLNSFLKWFEYF